MIKRLLLLSFIQLIGLTIYAQSEISVITNRRAIGKNHITHKDILANEIIFPEKIYETYLDTFSSYLTVQLRGTTKNGKWLHNSGKLIVYDLAGNTGKWSKYLNYNSGDIAQHGNLLIQTIGNKCFSLNLENGEDQWEVKNNVYYTEGFQKMALGYKLQYLYGDKNILEGIDLMNGNIKWQRQINRDYGWDNVFHLNDSSLIVVASGLHLIHVKDGTGWDYHAETGILTANGLAHHIVSNVLVDSANLYIASKEKISRLDHQGKIIWSATLPTDLTSTSTIFKKGNMIYLINRGFAYIGLRKHDHGIPFLAAYDSNTGKQIFVSSITDNKNQINDYQIIKDTLFLVFKDRISKYSLLNGHLISERTLMSKTYGEAQYFIGTQAYIQKDSVYQSLALSDTTKNYIYTKEDKILIINSQLEIVDHVDYKDLYIYYLGEKDYKFLAKGDNTLIIDKGSKVIGELNISGRTSKIGTKLYNIGEKSFIELDFGEVIKQK